MRGATLDGKLKKLVLYQFVPVLAVILVTFSALIAYGSKYQSILHNVTTVSEFNQDFKDSIDLKMYYYVVESRYSQGLPIEEVEAAQSLAQNLRDTTTQKESRKAITDVITLCENLEEKIYQIQKTQSYDERQQQLEQNIYVLTDMIQEYMYTYLYYEAAQLDELQEEMNRRLYAELGLILVLALLTLLFIRRKTLSLGRSITEPVESMCRRVEDIARGDLTARPPIQAKEYELQTLSSGIEQMAARLGELIEQNRQEQVSLRKAELALLQAQINPHFLYNTLDTIVWLVEAEKNEQAVEMVTSLSGYFRSSLSKGRDIITLREEEQHVRSYLEIQHVRYKDILEYEIAIDPGLYGCQIPKLTLQPLVENALYHGIKLKRGLGRIRVAAWGEGKDLLFLVEDNGAGMDRERLAQVKGAMDSGERVGFGLATVHERLQLLFGPGYGLTVESVQGKGTRVTGRIPRTEEKEETRQ